MNYLYIIFRFIIILVNSVISVGFKNKVTVLFLFMYFSGSIFVESIFLSKDSPIFVKKITNALLISRSSVTSFPFIMNLVLQDFLIFFLFIKDFIVSHCFFRLDLCFSISSP